MEERVRDDLQELVDEVSRLLGAPATLEDADFTLLAFCAHDDSDAGAMDAVRTRSILDRSYAPAPGRPCPGARRAPPAGGSGSWAPPPPRGRCARRPTRRRASSPASACRS